MTIRVTSNANSTYMPYTNVFVGETLRIGFGFQHPSPKQVRYGLIFTKKEQIFL